MDTIGRLAQKFGLSRSALLYYDRLGLLKPAGGGRGEYRRYGEAEAKRLERILLLRGVGLSLKEIRQVLDGPDSALARILRRRLEELNRALLDLRAQQRVIVGLLRRPEAMAEAEARLGFMNRETWVGLMEAAGFNREERLRWHLAFERRDPERHRDFLEFLCVPEEDVVRLRTMTEETIQAWLAAEREPPADED